MQEETFEELDTTHLNWSIVLYFIVYLLLRLRFYTFLAGGNFINVDCSLRWLVRRHVRRRVWPVDKLSGRGSRVRRIPGLGI
jgi:hypothetical protein